MIEDPAWLAFQRSIVRCSCCWWGGAVLAHGDGIRWPASGGASGSWRARLLTTIGTAIVFPTIVFFGILHAIALFSLMGLWFLDAAGDGRVAAALSLFPTMVWQHP